MSSAMKVVFGVMLLTGTMACGNSSMGPTPTTATATIMNGAITPNSINVSVGSTVTWMNKDTAPHSVVADTGTFNSGPIAPDGQFSFTFPATGTFAYHDPSNASLSGTVNVTASSGSY
jgi:plastocyanin